MLAICEDGQICLPQFLKIPKPRAFLSKLVKIGSDFRREKRFGKFESLWTEAK